MIYHIKKIRHLILALLLMLILITPLILKEKEPILEIHPAILGPGGGGVLNVNKDTLKYINRFLYGIKNNQLCKINTIDFLHPIPVHFFPNIQKSRFGLESYSLKINSKQFPFISFTQRNRFKKEELISAKLFYQQKLKSLGFSDSLFVYREYEVHRINSKIYSKKAYEYTYKLR